MIDVNQMLLSQKPVRDPNQPANREMGKTEFLNLLMTQLRFQDPTNVKDDKEFIAQLAQFSSLEQTTNMSQGLKGLYEFQQLTQGSILIDKHIEAQIVTKGEDGQDKTESISGVVTETRMADGEVKVMVNDKLISIKNITKVKN